MNNATATKTTKPRPSDVARWVAAMAAPEPRGFVSMPEWKAWERAQKHAFNQLDAHGLDRHGNPKPVPVLAWIRNLPEAGTVTDYAQRELDKLDRRAELLRQVAALDAEIAVLVATAESEIDKRWSDDEIAQAKGMVQP
jgi:hypothetical protein